jgi:hypothetical protein
MIVRLALLILSCLLVHCLGQTLTITSVSPRVRAPAGSVTVRGTGFTCASSSTSARVGPFAVNATIQIQNSSLMVLKMPTGSGLSLVLNITLKCGGSVRSASSPVIAQLSYRNTITSITPRVATAGSLVTVSGSNFVSPCTSSVGVNQSSSCKFVSSTSVVVRIPSNTGFDLDLIVKSNGLFAVLAKSFSYRNAIIGISRHVAVPGSLVTVSGSNFVSPCNASVGHQTANCTFISSTSVVVRIPSKGTGVNVNVTVVSNGLPALLSKSFSYSPRLDALRPSVIIPSADTIVDVLGSNFAPPVLASVNVNGDVIDAIECSVLSSSSLRIRFPPFSFSVKNPMMLVPFTVDINTIQLTNYLNFTFFSQPPESYPVPPKNISKPNIEKTSSSSNSGFVSGASDQVPSAALAGIVSGALFLSLLAFAMCAKRFGWCCFKNALENVNKNAAFYPSPSAFSHGASAPPHDMPHIRATSVENHMASAPPLENEIGIVPPGGFLEWQRLQYMAAYIAQQQAYIAQQQQHIACSMPPGHENYAVGSVFPLYGFIPSHLAGHADAHSAQFSALFKLGGNGAAAQPSDVIDIPSDHAQC